MAGLEVKVEGLAELARALEQLPKNIARNVNRGAVRAAAAVVRNDAKIKAPTDSGTLKRSIILKHIPERSNPTRQVFYVCVRKGKRYQKGQKVGKAGRVRTRNDDAFYGRFVEYGHFARRAQSGKLSSIRQKFGSRTNRGQLGNEDLAAAVQSGEVRWISPQPFMRPAWDARKQDAYKAMREYFEKRIPEEVRKVRAR